MKKIILLFSVLVCFSALYTIEPSKKDLIELMKKKSYNEVINSFDDYKKVSDTYLHRILSEAYFLTYERDKAIEVINFAIEIAEKEKEELLQNWREPYAELYSLKGNFLLMMKQIDKAENTYKIKTSIYKDITDSLFISNIHYARKQYRESVKLLEDYLSKKVINRRELPSILNYTCLKSYLEKQSFSIDRSPYIDKEDKEVIHFCSSIYDYNIKDYKNSLKHLEKLSEELKEYVDSKILYSLIMWRMGEKNKAIESYSKFSKGNLDLRDWNFLVMLYPILINPEDQQIMKQILEKCE